MREDDVGYLAVGQSQISEQAMRALEMKGDLPRLVDPRYSLGIQADDWGDFPYLYLRRKIGYQRSDTPPAVAAQRPQWKFGLPNFAGRPQTTIAHVTQLILHNGTAAALEFAWGLSNNSTPGASTTTNGTARDDRAFGPGAGNISQARLLSGSAVATILTGVAARFCMVPPLSTVNLQVDYVLTGKDWSNGVLVACGLVVEVTQVNVSATFGLVWTEREMVTSEVS